MWEGGRGGRVPTVDGDAGLLCSGALAHGRGSRGRSCEAEGRGTGPHLNAQEGQAQGPAVTHPGLTLWR